MCRCENSIKFLERRCTNHGYQVTWATRFCFVAPNIFGSSVWNIFPFTFCHVELLGGFQICGIFVQPCLIIYAVRSENFIRKLETMEDDC